MDADIFISLSHAKGHVSACFGGALKNIGMGCGSRAGKEEMHSSGKPVVDQDKCIGCDKCVRTSECTFEADDMKELNRTFPRPMRASSSRRSIILTSTPSSRRSSTAFTPTMKR